MTKYLQIVEAHWRPLVLLVALAVVLHFSNRIVDYLDNRAHEQNGVAQAALQAQIQKNNDQKKQLDQLISTVNQQNAKLSAAMVTRDAAAHRQQSSDSNLTLPDLGVRWSNLLSLRPADIQPAGASLLVSQNGTLKTVQTLELVPALQQDLADQKTISSGQDKEISGLNTRIDGLNTQLKDTETAKDKEVAVVKADARKSKRSWFIKGAVVGGAVVGYLLKGRL